VQKTFFADGADFAVAEKSGEAERAELVLHKSASWFGWSKRCFSTAVATAEAAAVNRRAGQFLFRAPEQFVHVLVAADASRR